MNPFTWIKKQSIFRDRKSVVLLLVGATLVLWVVVFAVANIHNPGFKPSVRYSGYFQGRLSDKSDWYLLYAFPLFALVSYVVNSVLAIKVHKLRPELSLAFLVLNTVLMVFVVMVTRAILSL
jgi:hypothetical protein